MPFDTRDIGFGFTTPRPFNAIYAIVDLNQDGRPDVLFFPNDFGATALQVYPLGALLNDGNGGLSLADSATFFGGAATAGATQVLAGDFNRDGRGDLFVSSLGYDFGNPVGTQNLLLLASASGGFTNATSTLPQVSDFTESAAMADIDGDGDLDILAMNIFGGTPVSGPLTAPYFLINDGAGRFTRADDRLPTAIAAREPSAKFTSVAFLDVNGDGRPDLFLGTHGDGAENSQVLLNDGNGRFSNPILTPPVLPSGQYSINDTLLTDLNGDGRVDMVLSVAVDRYASGRIQVLINDGGGQFSDRSAGYFADPALPSAPESIQAIDVNGDGLLDLVVRRGTTRPVYLNDGQGHFVVLPQSFLGLTDVVHRAAAADFNGDGRVDVFVEKANASLMLQLAPSASQTGTPGDDALLGGAPGETLSAGAGADVLFGGGGDDSLSGEDGDDRLVGGAGADTVSAGAGADTLSDASGTNYLRGDEGDDSIVGGAGFDDINGNMGNDTCVSGGGDDWVVGGKDNDSLTGSAGANLVYGNLGNDTCEGGAGNDIVRGGQQDDLLSGGAGDDYLSGDRGNDTVTGGGGADIFHSHSEAGVDRITDFNRGEGDQVQLLAGSTYTVAQVGADTVVTIGDSGAQLILAGVSMSSLTGNWITA